MLNLAQSCNLEWKHQNKVWNLFKIKNKDNKDVNDCALVSFLDFIHCYGVSIIGFEQVNAGWVALNVLKVKVKDPLQLNLF